MYNEQMEQLISAALADGVLTEKEKQILFKKAESLGIDLDEFEMVLDARLVELAKAEKAKAEASAPKSNKLGDIKKCPSCGAIVQSYQGVCPECGYAFEGMDANSAVKELSSLLRKTNDKHSSEKVVDTFPIPMEKSALIAFISWLKPQALDVKNPLSNAYMKKYEECIVKAKISFSTDKDFLPFIQDLEKDKKKRRSKHIFNLLGQIFRKKQTWMVIIPIIFVSFIVWLCMPTAKTDHDLCAKKVQKALEKNDLEKATDVIFDFRGYKSWIKGSVCAVVSEYLKQGNIDQAIRIYEKFDDFSVRRLIFDYLVEQGEYDRALAFASNEGWAFIEIVNDMCAKNRKADAIKLVNTRLTIDRYKSTKQEALKIINQY